MVKLMRTVGSVVCLLCMIAAPVHAQDSDIVQRLDRIERLLQSQGLLDMLQQIETLQTELSSLQGDIEMQNHSLEQMKKRQRDLYTDIDQRLQRLESSGVSTMEDSDVTFVDTDASVPPLQTIEPVAEQIEPTSVTQQAEDTLVVEVIDNKPPQAEPVPGGVPNADVEAPVAAETTDDLAPAEPVVELDPVQIRAQYQQAFKLLKQSQYEQAIKSFREFLAVNPQSEYSDNAQYWLGEAYYVTRQFETALEEYNKLLSNYPDSKKLTHSLLKIGFCYFEMGAVDEAKARLENLRQTYPGTTAARLADERLKKIALSERAASTSN